jgi:16S rRNA (cytidine1402-2'-O)-methyltransferase
VAGAIEYFKSQPPRGEFTLVIEGKRKSDGETWTLERMQSAIGMELRNGKSAKDISTDLAKESGWKKKEIYALINQNKE